MVDMIVNFAAVIVAALVPMVLGHLWYGPLFGKQWMKLVKVSKKDKYKGKKELPRLLAIGYVTKLVMAYGLAMMVKRVVTPFEVDKGALLGLLLGVTFIAMAKYESVLWERKPIGLYLINISYNLVSLMIMGAIFAYWI